MEFKVNEYQLPEKISFNFEELKQGITEKAAMYKSLVYTEEQVKEAKADRATLNKLKTAMNDERLKLEREYMKPFNEFKAQVNEIIKIIGEPIAAIDTQVKGYEEKKKAEKREKIESYIADVELNHAEKLQGIKIPFIDKWLNASVSMKSIEDEIFNFVEGVAKDLETLSKLPEFGFEATEVYKTSLDINRAISEAQRMSQIAKAKAEREALIKAQEEAKKAEQEFAKAMNPPVEPTSSKMETVESDPKVMPKSWVNFSAYMTVEQARELKKFFDDRLIEFKAI